MDQHPSSSSSLNALRGSALIGSRLARAPNYNEILRRLYLGNINTATNKEELSRLNITDLITIEVKPLQANDLPACVKRYLFINLMDHSKQDILSHFDASNKFIHNALKDEGCNILVHCVAGISRSASLVIAYVMKSFSMKYSEAYKFVKRKRSIVDPNDGFMRQLELYEKMGYEIDIGDLDYRTMVMEALVFEFRLIALDYYQVPGSSAKKKLSPFSSSTVFSPSPTERTNIIQVPASSKNLTSRQNIGILFDHYYNKLHLQEVRNYPEVYDSKKAFKCNKCRSIVFYAVSLIENRLTPSSDSNFCEVTAHRNDGQTSRVSKVPECPFVFIEPQPWMSHKVLERSGNIECYKCKRKLGKFDWTGGESCSCPLHSSHVNFNLFKIMRKKVETPSIN